MACDVVSLSIIASRRCWIRNAHHSIAKSM